MWNVGDHHVCCVASTWSPNSHYLLPPGHRGIAIKKYRCMSLASSQCRPYYQHYFAMVCRVMGTNPSFRKRTVPVLTPDTISQKVSWLWIFSQRSFNFCSRLWFHPWLPDLLPQPTIWGIVTTNSLISICCKDPCVPSNSDTTPVSTLKIFYITRWMLTMSWDEPENALEY